MLPEIASAVGDRTEVLFDGGIRSGQDVMKALALGARGCMIGRAYLYGLAAMGEAGVRKALDIIRQEMDITHDAHRRATGRCRAISYERRSALHRNRTAVPGCGAASA